MVLACPNAGDKQSLGKKIYALFEGLERLNVLKKDWLSWVGPLALVIAVLITYKVVDGCKDAKNMCGIVHEAGWPIWPLIIASVIAVAIIGERALALRESSVAPQNLLPEVQSWLAAGGVAKETIAKLEQHSPLGKVFASALVNTANRRSDQRSD